MVEIIPKAQPRFGSNILWSAALLFFLGVAAAGFLFWYLQRKTAQELGTIEAVLQQEKTAEQRALEEEIFGYQRKLTDLENILTSRKRLARLFEFLESSTHPRVQFLRFNFSDSQERFTLPGEAEGFQVLDEQFRLLKENPEVKQVSLSSISLGEKGEVSFTIDLSLSPFLFQ